jgi:hypothetical protein
MMQIIKKPLTKSKIQSIIKTMNKTFKGGEDMDRKVQTTPAGRVSQQQTTGGRAMRKRLADRKIGGEKIADWFEWLALNALGPDFYYSNSSMVVAKELLERLESHPARRWGWKWISVFDLYFNGIEQWDEMEIEEREELVRLLFEYMEKLSRG